MTTKHLVNKNENEMSKDKQNTYKFIAVVFSKISNS